MNEESFNVYASDNMMDYGVCVRYYSFIDAKTTLRLLGAESPEDKSPEDEYE